MNDWLEAEKAKDEPEIFSGVCAKLNLKLGYTIQNAMQSKDILDSTANLNRPDQCELNLAAAIFIYNFYNGGFEEFVDEAIADMTMPPAEPETAGGND